eukprot:SAG22_NODE_10291_length_543_cov_0.887387_1_plen_41_part_10
MESFVCQFDEGAGRLLLEGGGGATSHGKAARGTIGRGGGNA